MITVFLMRALSCLAEPPFPGTIFLDPEIITSEDEMTFVDAMPVGDGEFISDHARNIPFQENIAETFLAYLTIVAVMVLLRHNNDLVDEWEREDEDGVGFRPFSKRSSYSVGINITTYAMTH